MMKKTFISLSFFILSILLWGCSEEVSTYNAPVIDMNQNILTIEKDAEANRYYILIDHDIAVDTDHMTYDMEDIDSLVHNHTYIVSVGVYHDGIFYESNEFSFIFKRHLKEDLNEMIMIGKDEEINFNGDILNVYLEDMSELNKAYYQIEEKSLKFDQNYIGSLQLSTNHYIIETDLGYINLNLEIIDNEAPFITYSDGIKYLGEDVCFNVHLGSYESVRFSATLMTEDDYIYQDGLLTLNKVYISSYMSTYPEQSHLIVLATFTDQVSNNYYITMFIELNPS